MGRHGLQVFVFLRRGDGIYRTVCSTSEWMPGLPATLSFAEEEVVLINGGDIILLQSTNMNNILNDLLAVLTITTHGSPLCGQNRHISHSSASLIWAILCLAIL